MGTRRRSGEPSRREVTEVGGWTVNVTVHPLGTWRPFNPACAAWIGQDRGLAWSLSFSGGSPIAPWSFGHAGFHHDAGVAEVVVAIEL